MTASIALAAEIDALQASVKPLLDRIEALRGQRCIALSHEWIAANGVTRADVAVSDGPDVPFFNTLTAFAEWLRTTGNTRRWVEWNGVIYSAAEVAAGRMAREAPGRIEHVAP